MFGDHLKYIDLFFSYRPDLKRIVTGLLIIEDYVWHWEPQEDSDTPINNMKTFISIVESVYNNSHPYFGTLTFEGGDSDSIYEEAEIRGNPHCSFINIFNKTRFDKFDKIELDKESKLWKQLPDGGFIIQNIHPKSKSEVINFEYFK